MATRITIEPQVDHARASHVLRILKSAYPKSKLTNVSVIFSYTIDAALTARQLRIAAQELTNPLIEKSTVGTIHPPEQFIYALEIGFHPGVTDNVAKTAQGVVENAINRRFKNTESVSSSILYFFQGTVTKKEIECFAKELHNPLIERATIISKKDFKPRVKPYVPTVHLKNNATSITVNLNVSDSELENIGKKGIADRDGTRRGPLALSLNEMKTIQAYFKKRGRNPTDIELESLAQTWSEHCKHTIFNDPLDDIQEGIYKRYIRGATEKIRKDKGKNDFCGSVFVDNSGAIEFDEEYYVTHKVETHNSPSALDPFGGAITGIGGVNRDALGFGLGAKPMANVYGFCVGNPEDLSVLYRDQNKKEPLLSPKRILEGVVKGINAGGNQSGIPTPLGFVAVDPRFKGKPLVFAGTVGLIPKKRGKKNLSQKKARSGDYIVMLGGRVGLDGIHGATFSSEALSSGSPATAVQIGDPITQKKLSDALIRDTRDYNLYNSLTDNGAGGLSCSVAEMAKESGGFVVDIEKVPTKYPGIAPWQIWISESQERMTLSIPKGNWKKFKTIMDKHDVEATIIGVFTNSGNCIVRHKGKNILTMSMNFLHDGRIKVQQTSIPVKRVGENPPKTLRGSVIKNLLGVLARPTIASQSFIANQYDHEVQGLSVTKPLHGKGQVSANAGVLQPLPHSKKGVVLSHGYAPWYLDLDAYDMGAASVDTAVRNTIVAGGTLNRLAILDNFCWSSGNTPERLYELKETARACYDTAVGYGTPFISGKDSMYNDFKGFNEKGQPTHVMVPPTLLISALSVTSDITRALTVDSKEPEDLIYILGTTHDELGGSEYVQYLSDKAKKKYLGQHTPSVNIKENKRTYRTFEKANQKGLIRSAISIERGGLVVALSKMSLAGDLGCDISLSKIPTTTKDLDTVLFSESQGRILLTVSSSYQRSFEHAIGNIPHALLGCVTKKKSIVLTGKKKTLEVKLSEINTAYTKPFKQW